MLKREPTDNVIRRSPLLLLLLALSLLVARCDGDGAGESMRGSGGFGAGSGDAGAAGWTTLAAGGFPGQDCEACLVNGCADELQACIIDPICYSPVADGSGQYEGILACLTALRQSAPVTRADARDCAKQISARDDWPPALSASTSNLLNCLATGQSGSSSSDWGDDANIEASWPDESCAASDCTSQN